MIWSNAKDFNKDFKLYAIDLIKFNKVFVSYY